VPGRHRADGHQPAVQGGEVSARRGAAALLTVLVVAGAAGCGASGDTPHAEQDDPVTSVTSLAATASDDEMVRAVLAAVRYVCSAQLLLDAAPSELSDVVRSMWVAAEVDAALAATLDQLSQLRSVLGDGTGPTKAHQAVLSVRVDSTSPQEVVVSVWSVTVLYRQGAAEPQALWSTSTITLQPERGEWLVAAESTAAGPTPDGSVDAAPMTTEQFDAALAGFVDWNGQ
jgi:hypothetical protein